MPRAKQYVYLYESLGVTISEAQLGTGKTLTAYWATSKKGAPSALSSSTKTATASGGNYSITYSRTELQTFLASLIGQTVYLHLDDAAARRDVWEYVVTDTDPDLMPTLLS